MSSSSGVLMLDDEGGSAGRRAGGEAGGGEGEVGGGGGEGPPCDTINNSTTTTTTTTGSNRTTTTSAQNPITFPPSPSSPPLTTNTSSSPPTTNHQQHQSNPSIPAGLPSQSATATAATSGGPHQRPSAARLQSQQQPNHHQSHYKNHNNALLGGTKQTQSLGPPNTNNNSSSGRNAASHLANREEISSIGFNWMRVNGAFQQFRNILSSAAKGQLHSEHHSTTTTGGTGGGVGGGAAGGGGAEGRGNNNNPTAVANHHPSLNSEDPAIALINLEAGQYPKYTEEGGVPPGSGGSIPGGGPQQDNTHKTIVSSRLVRRKELYEKRKLSSDYALFFALLGIILMIIENELSAGGSYNKASVYSYVLKTLVLCSTLVLLALIACFHVLEVQLFMNDNSAEDWRIAMTVRRVTLIAIELAICAVCPIPGDFRFLWTTVHADGETVTTTEVPVDVLLSIPMFLRLYLIGRVMLLHSRLFTDASSRSIGALNRVHFNARFVLKTLMTLCPGTVLLVFTASLWVIASWILRLCERYHTGDPPNVQALKHQNYLNSLWMIAITFLSVGYGDIVPNTYCGRAVAVITGIMGAGTASMVVAVIARKLELTRAEKHVHNFMMDTQLTKRLKHAAANVLRETWLIYKHRRLVDKINPSRIRLHQRKFLMAIYELRKVKRDQRKLAENSMTVADIVKTATSTMEMVSDVHGWQESMDLRLAGIEDSMALLREDLRKISQTITQINMSGGSLGGGNNSSTNSLRHRGNRSGGNNSNSGGGGGGGGINHSSSSQHQQNQTNNSHRGHNPGSNISAASGGGSRRPDSPELSSPE